MNAAEPNDLNEYKHRKRACSARRYHRGGNSGIRRFIAEDHQIAVSEKEQWDIMAPLEIGSGNGKQKTAQDLSRGARVKYSLATQCGGGTYC